MQTIRQPMLTTTSKIIVEFLSDKGTVYTACVLFMNAVLKNIVGFLVGAIVWTGATIADSEWLIKLATSGFAFFSTLCLFLYNGIRLYREFKTPTKKNDVSEKM